MLTPTRAPGRKERGGIAAALRESSKLQDAVSAGQGDAVRTRSGGMAAVSVKDSKYRNGTRLRRR